MSQGSCIQRTWSGPFLKETTKTNTARYIPLSTRAREIVSKNVQDKLPGAPLFINATTGGYYRPKVLNNAWKQYSGIPVTYYEASRHSFCTQIAQTPGANVFDAQLLMGHSDPRTTQKYYHATPRRLEELVNRRGQVVDLNAKRDGNQKTSQS